MEFEIEINERIVSLLREHRYAELKPIVAEMNEVDMALVFEELTRDELPVLFRLLPKDLAAEVFVELDSDLQETLLSALNDRELKAVISELFLDDTVDLIEEMPANVVKRVLALSDKQTRREINEILRYPKDSAGSIMTVEYVYLKVGMTVEQALEKIRRRAIDSETIYTCYVTDRSNKLLGFVTAKALLLADPEDLISDIMETNVIYSETTDNREDVARKLGDHGFLALPIVDKEERLVGIVTVDDAIDVIEEETTEDIEMMAAIISSDDTPYLKRSIWEMWKSRIPWLLLLLISSTFTGLIITSFEERLSALSVVLFACVPMLMGSGGNCGSQSSVTVIRSLSLGELETRDVFRVMWKELRVSILVGATLAVACFAKLLVIDKLIFGVSGYEPMVCTVISIALFATVVLSKLVGCSLPILAKQCRLDPAVVASPFITTIIDALSLILYCYLAIAILS